MSELNRIRVLSGMEPVKAIGEEPVKENVVNPANINRELADEIQEFIDRTKEALNSIERQLDMGNETIYRRAKGYWIAHIRGALDKDHGYMGGSMMTAASTVNELLGREEEE